MEKCSICKKEFKSKESLILHMGLVHKENESERLSVLKEIYPNRQMACSVCGKELSYNDFRQNHIVCSKECRYSSKIMTPILNKRLETIKEKGIVITPNIKAHEEKQIIINGVPFKDTDVYRNKIQGGILVCFTCGKEFKTYRSLALHLGKYKLASKEILNEIFYLQNPEKKVVCPICNKNFCVVHNREKGTIGKTCSEKCMRILSGKEHQRSTQTLESKKKRKETVDTKYGSHSEMLKLAFSKVDWGVRNKKSENTMKNRYGSEYYASTEECKKRREKTCLDKYGEPSALLLPHSKEKAVAANNIRYERLHLSRDETELKSYREKVSFFTNKSFSKFLEDIILPNSTATAKKWFSEGRKRGVRKGSLHLDHMFSVIEGFNSGVPAEVVGNPTNLRLTTITENVTKNFRSCLSQKELFERYEEFNINFGILK